MGASLGVQIALTTTGVTEAAQDLKAPKDAADGLATSAEGAQSALEGLKGALEALGVGAGFTELVKQADEALETFERLTAQFEALNRSQGDAATATAAAANDMNFVAQTADTLGVNLLAASQSFAQLEGAARNTSNAGQGAKEIFDNVASAAAGMHLSTDQTSQAFTVFARIMSTSQVNATQLRRTLGQDFPGAMQLAAQSLGMTEAQFEKLSAAGMIPAATFAKAFAAQLQQTFGADAPDALNSTQQATNRLQNAFDQLKIAMGEGMSAGLMDALTSLTTALKDPAIAAAATELGQDLGSALKVLAEVIIVVVQNWDIFKAVLEALIAIEVVSWLGKVGTALQALALSNPYTAILALVIAINSMVSSWRDSIEVTDQTSADMAKYQDVLKLLPGPLDDASAATLRLSNSQAQQLHQAVTALTKDLKDQEAELQELKRELNDPTAWEQFEQAAGDAWDSIIQKIHAAVIPGSPLFNLTNVASTGTAVDGLTTRINQLTQSNARLEQQLTAAQKALQDFQNQANHPTDPATKGALELTQQITKLVDKFASARNAAVLENAAIMNGVGAEQLATETAKANEAATNAANGVTNLSAEGKKALAAALLPVILNTLQLNDQTKNLNAAQADQVATAGNYAETLAKLSDAENGNTVASDAAKAAVAALTEMRKENDVEVGNMLNNGTNAAAIIALLTRAETDETVQLTAGQRAILANQLARVNLSATVANGVKDITNEVTYLNAWHQAEAALSDSINQSGAAAQAATIAQQVLTIARLAGKQGDVDFTTALTNLLTVRQQEIDKLGLAKAAQDALTASRTKEKELIADTTDWQTQQAAIATYGTAVEGILAKYGVLSQATQQQKVYEDALSVAISHGTDLMSPLGQQILAETQARADATAAVQRYQAAVEIAAQAGQDLVKGWQQTESTIEDTIANALSGIAVNWKSILQQIEASWIKTLEQMGADAIQKNLAQSLLGGNVTSLGNTASGLANSSAPSALTAAATNLSSAGGVLMSAGNALLSGVQAQGLQSATSTQALTNSANYIDLSNSAATQATTDASTSLFNSSGLLATDSGNAASALINSSTAITVAAQALGASGSGGAGGGGGLIGSLVSAFGAGAVIGVGGFVAAAAYIGYQWYQSSISQYKPVSGTYGGTSTTQQLPAGATPIPSTISGNSTDQAGQQFVAGLNSFFTSLQKAVGGFISAFPEMGIAVGNAAKGFEVTMNGVITGDFATLDDALTNAIELGLQNAKWSGVSSVITDYLSSAIAEGTAATNPQAVIDNATMLKGILDNADAALAGAGASIDTTMQGFIDSAAQMRQAVQQMGLSASDLATVMGDIDAAEVANIQQEYDTLTGKKESNAQIQAQEAAAFNAKKAIAAAEIQIEIGQLQQQILAVEANKIYGDSINTVGKITANGAGIQAKAAEVLTGAQQTEVNALNVLIGQLNAAATAINNIPDVQPGQIVTGDGSSSTSSAANAVTSALQTLTTALQALAENGMDPYQKAMQDIINQYNAAVLAADGNKKAIADLTQAEQAQIQLLNEQTNASIYANIAALTQQRHGLDSFQVAMAALSTQFATYTADATAAGAGTKELGAIIADEHQAEYNLIMQTVGALSLPLDQTNATIAQYQNAITALNQGFQDGVISIGQMNIELGQIAQQGTASILTMIENLYTAVGDTKDAEAEKQKLEQINFEIQMYQLQAQAAALYAMGVISSDLYNQVLAVETYFKNNPPNWAAIDAAGNSGGGDTGTPSAPGGSATDPATAALQLLQQYESSSQSAAQAADLGQTLLKINTDFQTIANTLGNTAEVQAAYAAAVHDAIVKFLDPIQQLMDGLNAGSSSPLTAVQQFQSAMSALMAAEASFRSGNLSGLANVPSLVNAALAAAKLVAPQGSAGYDAIYAQIQTFLSQILALQGPAGANPVAGPAPSTTTAAPPVEPTGGLGYTAGGAGAMAGWQYVNGVLEPPGWTPPPSPVAFPAAPGQTPIVPTSSAPGQPPLTAAQQSAPVVSAIQDQTTQQLPVLNKMANTLAGMAADLSAIRTNKSILSAAS
jgi:hypothetical protein